MKEKNQIPEKANLTGKVTQTVCDNCFEDYLFALKDKNHEFSIGLIDILRCLKFAEDEGAVPKISADWWIRACSHKMNMQIFKHNFVKIKAKICRNTDVLQEFSTQKLTKFAKICVFGFNVNTL